MKIRRLLLLLGIAILTSLNATAQCTMGCWRTDTVEHKQQQYSPSTLILWYDASTKKNKKRLLKAVHHYKATVIYDYKNFNGLAIKLPQNADIDKAIDYFGNVKGVLSVNRDAIMHLEHSRKAEITNK